MCGIVGYIGNRSASGVLLDGLKRLEYRGYDSSGLAVLCDGKLNLRRSVGKILNLRALLTEQPLKGGVGLGHTRWATHGVPSEQNAHPHTDCSKRFVVVHNGIIENYSILKHNLIKKGHRFESQTDTEVIAHLLEEAWGKKNFLEKEYLDAVRGALNQLEGAFALGILCVDFPELLVAARRDCPLVLGVGKNENFVASDIPALLHATKKVVYLEQNEVALVRPKSIECFNLDGYRVKKEVVTVRLNPLQAEKANYKHFMLKEIMEQNIAIQDTLRGRLFAEAGELRLNLDLRENFLKQIDRITLIACGTSYHAALVGRYYFEALAKIPVTVEIASEFRYRDTFLGKKDLAIYISQSGETADTLAALRKNKKMGVKNLAICNVLGSSLAREADTTFFTHCGPEIGVASTKAFTGQLTALLLLAIHVGMTRGALEGKEAKELLNQFLKLPAWIRQTCALSKKIKTLARRFIGKDHFLYLGRNLNYPIALEGALKLKEVSYIHAEGYPAGEMKHGPIALINREMPLVALVTESPVYDKICSNIEEAKARGGTVIAIATEGDKAIRKKVSDVLYVPKAPDIFSPMINVIPLQLFAYHVADLRGCDVDCPRNLAKSVTVE